MTRAFGFVKYSVDRKYRTENDEIGVVNGELLMLSVIYP
jgi:hypothetical protein